MRVLAFGLQAFDVEGELGLNEPAFVAVNGDLLVHLDIAVDGIVAIETAENALHDDLRALLWSEEPIAGLQFPDED